MPDSPDPKRTPGRRLAALAALFAVVLAVGWGGWRAWRSYEKSLKGLVSVNVDRGVGLAAKEVVLTQGEGGRTVWRLVAESAQYRTEAGVVEVESPVISYFHHAESKTGQQAEANGREPAELVVRAPRGEVDRSKDTARLWPRVEGEQGDARLVGETLTYVGASRLATLAGERAPVSLKRDGMSVEAPRMEIDVRSRTVTALGGVTTVLPPRALNTAGAAERSAVR